MTDESPQLSRRERRAQEAREAARRAEDTASLDMSPISDSIPTHAPDGRVLSRRERRRLERLQNPVETWTAEEEMIATGQIPAMTPERIAEQERVAREKAEQAQADAMTASEEMQTLTDPAAGGGPTVDEAEPPAASAEPQPPHEPEAPQRTSLMAAAATADEGKASFEPEPEPEPAPEPQPEPEPAPEPEPVPEPESEPVPEPESEPESAPEPVGNDDVDTSVPEAAAAWAAAASSAPEPASRPVPEDEAPDATEEPAPARETVTAPENAVAPETAEATPLGMPPGMSPEMFAALFPPGSLQRRLMEQQSSDPTASSAPGPDLDRIPDPEPEPQPVEDGAAEIRRLSQEAIAGIDAASGRSAPSAPDTAARQPTPGAAWTSAPWEHSTSEPEPSAPSAPAADEPTWQAYESASDSHDARTGEEPPAAPSPGLWQASASAVSAPEAGDAEPAPHSGPIQLDAADFRERARNESAAPSFDAILGTGDAAQTAALDDVSTGDVAAGAAAFDVVNHPSEPAREALSSASAPVTGQWATLPLNQVDHRAQDLPEVAPRTDIAHPDLSSVGRATFSPQADYSHIEPVPTGQIEVPPREKPQLNPAGGARHFRWVHVLVLGAVAFLIGVVVWNVWGGPS
ncbi:hypothetical protein [Demequina activiva]|uniref:Uncharacterized protein n=1 Tax=Demequina activiva TaxID=1582364 RepID=A0A919ULV8_9MICO|nr:hypothetical protein [Demequina activiva]GIG55093.1 hypothetical protein Dac01nite_18450 [Demequina activiva]